jgi:hypothetical protein
MAFVRKTSGPPKVPPDHKKGLAWHAEVLAGRPKISGDYAKVVSDHSKALSDEPKVLFGRANS